MLTNDVITLHGNTDPHVVCTVLDTELNALDNSLDLSVCDFPIQESSKAGMGNLS
jgi:hypothetical protein